MTKQLCDLGVDNYFIDRASKYKKERKKYFIKKQKLLLIKTFLEENSKMAPEEKKIFAIHIFDKDLCLKQHKEFTHLKKKYNLKLKIVGKRLKTCTSQKKI